MNITKIFSNLDKASKVIFLSRQGTIYVFFNISHKAILQQLHLFNPLNFDMLLSISVHTYLYINKLSFTILLIDFLLTSLELQLKLKVCLVQIFQM